MKQTCSIFILSRNWHRKTSTTEFKDMDDFFHRLRLL